MPNGIITMTTQSQTEKEALRAHIDSTCDLLMDVFEAQKIPAHVALVAMARAVMKTEMHEVKNLSEFIVLMKFFILEFDKTVPKFIFEIVEESYKKLTPEQKLECVISMVRNGPESVKIKNGAIVR